MGSRGKKGTFFWIDPEVHQALKLYCSINRIQMSEIVETLLRDFLTEKGFYPPEKVLERLRT